MKYIIAAIVSVLGATAPAQQPTPADLVHVQVDPHTVLTPIADDFIGLGYETSAVAHAGFFSAKNTHLVQLYRTLSTGGLVRIGGIIGDHTRFEPEGTPLPRSMQDTTVINAAVLADLGGFLRATGWKAMWTLNLGTGTKEEAAAEAVAVNAALGDRLQSFEIGNEVDQLKRFDGYAGYHAAYLDYKAAIRAVLPGAVFSGPDSAGNVDWSVAFAKTEAADMGLLIHHYYRGGTRTPQATIETLLSPHPEWEGKLQKLHDACAGKGIGFRINEVNSFYGGGKADVSDTFASALWCLDYMFRVAAHGGAGVNMETDVNQLGFVSHYSPIFRDGNDQLSARPEYYGMLAFAMAGQGSLVKLTASETPVNLSAYATKGGDGLVWVTLVNKDLARAATVELTPPAGCTMAEVFRLVAPSAQSKGDVTLAGARVSPDGTWAPGAAEKIIVAGNLPTLTLPAASAALVRLGSTPMQGTANPPQETNRLPIPKEQFAAGYTEVIPTAATAPADWRWTTAEPAKEWAQPGFKDKEWTAGKAMFGTATTPGTEGRLNTIWNTKDLWIRREVQLPAQLGSKLRLIIHHDNDADVYINGVLAWHSQNIETRDYAIFEISPEAQARLQPGAKITLAAHGHNRTGGQALDVGLVSLK